MSTADAFGLVAATLRQIVAAAATQQSKASMRANAAGAHMVTNNRGEAGERSASSATSATVGGTSSDVGNAAVGNDGLDSRVKVLVACSGGADSLALAITASRVNKNVRVGAAIIDHDMQTGSAQVAATAAQQCRDLGLDPVVVRKVTVASQGGPEAAARDARYKALADIATETGAQAILLGHTLDDQAETVLLALARGSGTRSLAGMPAQRGMLWRPFLPLRRADTKAVCLQAGVTWWDDPTNTSGPNMRARVRNELLPVLRQVLGEGAVLGLARTAELTRADADVLDRSRDLALTNVGDSAAVVDLLLLPAAIRRRVIRALLLRAGASPGAVNMRHIRAIDNMLTSTRCPAPGSFPSGITVSVECGRLYLRQGNEEA